jgi:uncharacterized membrane protein YvbJ
MVSLSVVVALLFGAFALSGCGGDTSSPENVVKAYHEAMKAKDKERFKKLLSKDDLKNMKENDDPKSSKNMDGDYSVGSATINGDSATVPVTYTKDGKESAKMDYYCVKEDGEWKVALGKTFTEMMKKAFSGMMGNSGG